LSQNEPQTPRPPHDEPMTGFERLIISRMDDITEQQHQPRILCHTIPAPEWYHKGTA